MKYNLDFGIKSAVKEWMNNKYENWVKQPIENKTIELESFISQQVDKAVNQGQKYNPVNHYQNQPIFNRGLILIAGGVLVVLWLLSS